MGELHCKTTPRCVDSAGWFSAGHFGFIDVLRGRSQPRLYRGRLRRLRTAETLREYPARRKRWFRAVHSDIRAAFCAGGFAVALLSAFADKNTDSTKGKTVGLRNACPYDS